MDEMMTHKWQLLHRRFVLGESLTAAERVEYEAGCNSMDTGEILDGNLDRLRAIRAQISEAEAVQQHLHVRERDLDRRIAELEARLDARTRGLLGIGR